MKAIAKKTDCEIIGEWSRSITNHLYWCATSTPSGDKELIKAKWLSLDNHIHNKHSHTGMFKKCVHKRLRNRKWLKRREYINHYYIYIMLYITDTKASEHLNTLITNTKLCNDIGKLSPKYQTSSLEAFHSVMVHFLPKSTAFSYEGMLGRYMHNNYYFYCNTHNFRLRIASAALHFNENAHKDHAETRDGEKQYSISFPKYKLGGYIVRKVLVPSTYGNKDLL